MVRRANPKVSRAPAVKLKNLKAARTRLELEQSELAKAAGIAPATLSLFENGKRPPHEATRRRIQEALEARGIVFTNGDKPGFYFDKDKVIIPS
jgi:transcriptional regulator with XRE-family HTH domain